MLAKSLLLASGGLVESDHQLMLAKSLLTATTILNVSAYVAPPVPPPTPGPFYFAWVDQDQTIWSTDFLRFDEQILTISVNHSEGQSATAMVAIRNPRVGLLAHGRQIWAWFAWLNPKTNHIEPFFFGRLVGVPTNLLRETVTVSFIAQSLDFLAQQQQVAETLKVRPGYDPVFYDPAHRDDPNAILEGYPGLYHVDRVTHAVTFSDYLVGEDGIEVFLPSDVPYDSLDFKINQPPVAAVNMDADVHWTQTAVGNIDMGDRTWFTYTGASLITDWPKPLASLGGGWSCQAGYAADTYGLNTAIMYHSEYHYQNQEKQHADGDTMSVSNSQDIPISGAPYIKQTITSFSQSGFIDPEDPDAVDIPTSQNNSTVLYIPQWRVDTSLSLRYDANRPRTERVRFTLQANVQPVLTPAQSPPLPVQETITLSGSDVSEPLELVLDWLSVKGQHVNQYTVIYPNQPTVPGGGSYQLAIQAGTAGTAEPIFSPIIGDQTSDGGVIWASLGTSLPTVATDWTSSTEVQIGTLLRPLQFPWAPWGSLVPPPRLFGTSFAPGQICRGSNGSYQVCFLGGLSGLSEPAFSRTWGVHTTDNEVDWVCIGTATPTGSSYFLCVQAGDTGLFEPPFGNPGNSPISDGGAVWIGINLAGNFLTLPIVDLSRRSYFPTDRGLWSLEHLISRARARLIKGSRVVQIDFDCTFDRAMNLSCRKNALVYDPRLPGGQALGKIISYKIDANVTTGLLIGHVTMACAVGFGGAIVASPGQPTYCDGYCQGYRYSTNQINALPSSDVGYTVPADGADDDGLIFPLTKSQVVVVEAGRGSTPDQLSAIYGVLPIIVAAARLGSVPGGPSLAQQEEIAFLSRFTVETALGGHAIWYDLQLKPVVNGPFQAEYQILTTQLEVPKQVDTEAPSL